MAAGGACGGCSTGAGWDVVGAVVGGGATVVLGGALLGAGAGAELSGAWRAGAGFGCAGLAWEAGGCWANTTPNTAANAVLPTATDRLTTDT